MDGSHDVILTLYGLATAIGITLGVVIWRYRDKTGAVPLVVVLFGTAFFSTARFVATGVDSFAISVLMERLVYLGVGTSIVGGVLLALEYTGREHLVTRTTVALLSIEPILAIGFAFLNPGNLFFESFDADPTMPTGVAVDWGIAFGVHTAYSYLLMAAVTAMILEFLYNARALYRGQAAALLGAAILPWIANAVHVLGPVDADTTPVGYVLLGALYAVAIVRYQLIDLVPIARDRVLDTVSEGVFVIDRNDRLIDVNPAAREMIDVDPETTIIGREIRSLFANDPEVIDLFDALTTTSTESSAELAYHGRYYEVQATPIADGRDRHVGWLVLVYDISDRNRREAELERQNERLDQFASLVSHDLRNPLNVAAGYLKLARETGDSSHLERIERSHDRMETIIDDVLTLAREGQSVTEPTSVSLETLAERAWDCVDTGDASLAIDRDVTIRADPERTTRLLENLFRNSIEHGSTSSRDGSRPDDGLDHGPTSPASRTRRDAVERGSASSQHGFSAEHGVEHGFSAEDGVEHGSTTGASLTIEVGPIGAPEDSTLDGFYVGDDGVGIPADQRGRIFEDGYSTSDFGTGFGLRIVQQIAGAHGWSVDVTDGEAGGARFELTGVEPAVSDRPEAT